MADAPFTPEPKREEQRSAMVPMIAGVLVIGLVIGAVLVLGRRNPNAGAIVDPYAQKLQLSDLKMTTAQNFVRATVIYLEGTARNTGDKTVSHAGVEAEFKDAMGQVVLREQRPLMVTEERPNYSDNVDLNVSPLKPGQSKQFRLSFEGVPNDWNRQAPDLRISSITTR
jgi:Protein of unknown function (DUF3426)